MYDWYYMFVTNLRSDIINVNKLPSLEKLRKRYFFTNQLFFEVLIQSEWVTKTLQIRLYEQAKIDFPELTDKEIFKTIIMSRTISCNAFGLEISEYEVDEALNNIKNLDDLIIYIIEQDKLDEQSDIFGMRNNINETITKIMESK